MSTSETKAVRRGRAITEGVIWKQLLLFFFPILLGTFFQQLYNTVDAMVVGKAVGKEALSAVGGSTATLINLLVGFFVGLSSGATVIISQFYGGQRDRDVSDAVHTAMAMALLFSAFLTAVGIALAPGMLRMMNTPEDVLPHAVTYMRIYFAGTVASMIYNIGSGILRAIGDSRRPLYFLIVSCLTNIALDLLFVVAFHMGVAGVALATILSQCVAAGLVVLSLSHTHESYCLRLRDIRLHRALLGRIVHIGLPAGLQSVLYSVSNVIIQAAINGFGTDVIAGWTAASKMDNAFWMIINAFGISITTFIGQNFGDRRYDRMRQSVRVCLLMSLAATVLVCSALLLFGSRLLWLFSSDPVVIEQGLAVMRFMVPTYVTYICIEVFSGALRGAGDSVIPTVMTLVGVCLLRTVWVAVMVPAHHTLITMLLSYPISWVVGSLMFVVYYYHGGWLKRCIAKAGFPDAPEGEAR